MSRWSAGTSADHGVDAREPGRPGRRRRRVPAGRSARPRSTVVGRPRSGRPSRRPSTGGRARPRRGGPGEIPVARPAGRRRRVRHVTREDRRRARRAPPRRASPARGPPVAANRRATASVERAGREVVGQPGDRRDVGEVAGPVAYRKTERVIPPCHHWSWSSMNVASDHLTTRRRSVLAPGRPDRVRSNSAARWESLLIADLDAVERHDQDALGGADVEHDPPARPTPPGARTRARRRRSGSPRARSAGRSGKGIWTFV